MHLLKNMEWLRQHAFPETPEDLVIAAGDISYGTTLAVFRTFWILDRCVAAIVWKFWKKRSVC